ncbi:GGDEF domain-containing protein [Colwellia sp. Arc7-635]|uniref:ligand-binding sensor domain-containing diguanylate cyclase n=1 Tax=Colwellia sp. Arc7-635 TaxID=2497879 RepID=UPI000F85A0EB|nr:ligand-binding sensor domain-containing diguanylate cyclase [Colwellia sp. Arc7-635]AZQ84879.1 GGDEF domain-containing protein [Colwellia sp. Arc7-635]
MFKQCIFLFLLCFLLPNFSLTSTVANELTYKQLEQLHEAANNGFIEDDDGFIWLGTQRGLLKWMGEQLILYTPENSSIIGANISAIVQGDNGVIWVGTLDGGLNKYDKLTNKFVHVQGKGSSSVNSIGGWRKTQPLAFVNNNELVFVSDQRLIHFKKDTFTEIPLDDDKQILTGAVFCQEKECWFGIEGALVLLDLNTHKTTVYPYQSTSEHALSINKIIKIDGMLYIATQYRGLLQFNAQTTKFSTLIPYQNKPITNFVYENIKQQLWLIHSPSIGLTQFSIRSGLVESHFSSASDLNPLSDIRLSGLLFSKRKQLLAFTLGGDLGAIEPKLFTSITKQSDLGQGLISNNIRPIYQTKDGTIWLGTKSEVGLHHYDEATKRFIPFADPKASMPYVIYEDSSETLWLASLDGSLSALDSTRTKVEEYFSLNAKIGDIVEHATNPSLLWLATYDKGLLLFDKNIGLVEQFQHNSELASSISSNFILKLLYVDQELWLGTMKGLNHYNEITHEFSRYEKKLPSENKILNLLPEESGKIWVVNDSNGIDLFDPKNETFEEKFTNVGFPIKATEQDDKGNLYGYIIKKGLFKFNTLTETFHIYGKEYNLPLSFWLVAHHKMFNGDMWFGSQYGLTIFNPENLSKKIEVNKVYFTRLNQNGHPIETDTAYEKLTSLSLDWQNNVLEFGYVGKFSHQSKEINYRYKMEGVDASWFYTNYTQGRYVGLDSGNYLLRVSMKVNGQWSSAEQEAQLKIVISTPIWRLWWPQLLMLIIFIFIIVVVSYSIIAFCQNRTLKKDVYLDPLTGCYNRRYLQNTLSKLDERLIHRKSISSDSAAYAFLFFDLDNFKNVNDEYGHDVGDIVLQHFAKVLQSQCRVGDTLARWGGEEFVMVCQVNSKSSIPEICQRMIQTICNKNVSISESTLLEYTCSIGAISYPDEEQLNAQSAEKIASVLSDFALYQAKEKGRNTWCVIETTSSLDSTDLHDLNHDKVQQLISERKLNLIHP